MGGGANRGEGLIREYTVSEFAKWQLAMRTVRGLERHRETIHLLHLRILFCHITSLLFGSGQFVPVLHCIHAISDNCVAFQLSCTASAAYEGKI